jgi:hypothetical protein
MGQMLLIQSFHGVHRSEFLLQFANRLIDASCKKIFSPIQLELHPNALATTTPK